MHWTDVFQSADTVYPLVAGMALALGCGLLSVIVVQKRLAFIGEGVAHAGFGGVGLASFLALSGPARDLTILAFCAAAGLSIGFLSRHKRILTDSAIGILLVASMALGLMLDQLRIVYMDAMPQPPEWYAALTGGRMLTRTLWENVIFGSILMVRQEDMWIALAAATAVVATLALLAKEILFYAFDETVSQVFGVRTGAIHYLILLLISLMIVLATKLAGLLLVTALLVAPGATAALLSKRLPTVLAISVAVGMLAMTVGYLASFEILDGRLPPGPFIALLLVLQFLAALLWSRLWGRG